MSARTLGRPDLPVSAIGLGCWAIGGPFWSDGKPIGWGEVDDDESVRAIRRALELGVTFFDTSDVYGAGHSERVLGRALAGRRDEVVIATKFGNTFDESSREITGSDASPEGIRRACEASLRRLGTGRIDLYQLHLSDYPPDAAAEVCDVLEELVSILGRSERCVPIPGFRTEAQVEQNCTALADPPLTAEELGRIDALLGRAA